MSAPPAGRFTESVDWVDGRVFTSGRLTSAAADLVGGTAEQLRRAGHASITVELHATEATDDDGLAALRAVAADLRVRHCQLIVVWEEKENLQ